MEAASVEPPAVARQRVRRALRNARLETGLVQGDVARRLNWSLSKVQRIESGSVAVSVTDLHALLGVYGVDDEGTVESLARDAAISRRQRWTVPAAHREHLTPGLLQLLQFEGQATVIRAYQPFTFPGVLQTPATAEYVLGWFSESLTEDDRKVRLDVRMARSKRIVEDDRAPTYLLMLDEAALSREIGGRAIMAEQLEAAIEFAQRPNIHIRIVRLAEGMHLGMLGPFTLLDLSDDDIGDAVLYREFYTSDNISQDDKDVAYYRARFEAAWSRCYDEADSLRLIRAAAAALRASLVRDR
ncbi:helix-turn-helix domain-containing protein [Actinoplanes nipponensis]|uniref:Transcriptional regulator n=1 Tax=Actinoplanes nipponensis TaxID=135950 RepID=A0A919JL75_9ACTN|nr:helix-turn-helix transcriptional regulator [Actinoplanes nipponensis]GIE51192.1 transcriptional regulator [Actinoplanes nipponensis]